MQQSKARIQTWVVHYVDFLHFVRYTTPLRLSEKWAKIVLTLTWQQGQKRLADVGYVPVR